MRSKQKFTIRLTATFGLVLALLGTAWALNILEQIFHSDSTVILNGGGGTINIVNNGTDQIKLIIPQGALNTYMADHLLDGVNITVDTTEELIERDDGSTYWRLDFHFGPSSAYFDPPLILKLKGKYVSQDTQVWLYDETGEALEGTRTDSADMIRFEIPHFSSYYYDDYDY